MSKNHLLHEVLSKLKFDPKTVDSTLTVLKALDEAKTSDDFREQVFKYAEFLGLIAADADKAYYTSTPDYKDNDDFLAETVTSANHMYGIPGLRSRIKGLIQQIQGQHQSFLHQQLNTDIKAANIPKLLADIKKIDITKQDAKILSIEKALKSHQAQVELSKKRTLADDTRAHSKKGHQEGIERAKAEYKRDVRTNAEIDTAVHQVQESVEIVKQQIEIATKSNENINLALNAINNPPPLTYDETLKQINTIRKHLIDLKQAPKKIQDAEIIIENASKRALNPSNVLNKQERATTWMEKYNLLGFTDVLVSYGDKPLTPVVSQAHHGQSTVYEGVRLNPGDTIHSTMKCKSGADIRLVQDANGHVFDHSVHLQGDEKELAAVKMAKMLLSNYNPANGPIVISGGNEAQAKRLYAALLLLSSKNDYQYKLKRSNIQCDVFNFHKPGRFSSNAKFIAEHLHIDEKTLGLEVESIASKNKEYKEKFQTNSNIEIDDLPVGIQLKK